MSFEHPPLPRDDAPFDDPDNPEWTEETFARGRAQEHLLPPEVMALAPRVQARVRGLQRTPTKAQVTLRLDRNVLEHFRASGPGWQSYQQRPAGGGAERVIR